MRPRADRHRMPPGRAICGSSLPGPTPGSIRCAAERHTQIAIVGHTISKGTNLPGFRVNRSLTRQLQGDNGRVCPGIQRRIGRRHPYREPLPPPPEIEPVKRDDFSKLQPPKMRRRREPGKVGALNAAAVISAGQGVCYSFFASRILIWCGRQSRQCRGFDNLQGCGALSVSGLGCPR